MDNSEINLKSAPFNARGDGTTDDSDAVQAWLNCISSLHKLGVVPPGNYKLTRAMIVPRSDFWGIRGAGRYLSTFFYAGLNKMTVNILEIGDASANSQGINLRGLSLFSLYDNMSDGFALKANRLANSSLSDITFGGELYARYTANGVWFNGAHQVFMNEFDSQTNGDGVRVNGIDNQSCSDLYLDQGFSTNNGICGVRCAGHFGGLYLDEVETLANGNSNLIVDSSQAADGNREIILGSNYISDGVHNASQFGILVDDPKTPNGTIICHGLIGSSIQHGVYIKQWPSGSFIMSAGRIFNNLIDGVHVEDASALIVIGNGVSIDHNRGWGVRSVASSLMRVAAAFSENTLGNIAPAHGMSTWMQFKPIITSAQGALRDVSGSISYVTFGKTVHFTGQVEISDNGTAAGSVMVTLPLPPCVAATYFCSGRADAVSGKMLQGVIRGPQVILVAYDNTYPGSDGERLIFSGTYEADQT